MGKDVFLRPICCPLCRILFMLCITVHVVSYQCWPFVGYPTQEQISNLCNYKALYDSCCPLVDFIDCVDVDNNKRNRNCFNIYRCSCCFDGCFTYNLDCFLFYGLPLFKELSPEHSITGHLHDRYTQRSCKIQCHKISTILQHDVACFLRSDVVLFAVFVGCCGIPYLLWICYETSFSFRVYKLFSVLQFIVASNSTMNPMLYLWRLNDLREAAKATVKQILRIN
jgi:hypothetical protein